MKVKLDENLGERGRAFLAECGHDVATVASQRMEASLDPDLINACRDEGRCLVTLDMDFASPLEYPPEGDSGIAVLRPHGRISQNVLDGLIRTFAEGLKKESISGRLWIVEIDRIRIHDTE